MECQWRRKKTVETVQAASQMFPLPVKKKDYSPLSRAPKSEDREWLYGQLRQYGKFTGVCWLLSREPEPAAQLPLKTIEEIVFRFTCSKALSAQLHKTTHWNSHLLPSCLAETLRMLYLKIK